MRIKIDRTSHTDDQEAVLITFRMGIGPNASMYTFATADRQVELRLESVSDSGGVLYKLVCSYEGPRSVGLECGITGSNPLLGQGSEDGQLWLKDVSIGGNRLPIHVDVEYGNGDALDEWSATSGIDVSRPAKDAYPYQICIDWENDEVWRAAEDGTLPPVSGMSSSDATTNPTASENSS